MARALARPEDILVAYDSGVVSVGAQASPLEVYGGRPAFREMTGGADTYYEDFTSGLRDFVAARQEAAGGFGQPDGGSTLVGGWFGGGGADPSALVMGLDWLAGDGASGDGASGDGTSGDGTSGAGTSNDGASGDGASSSSGNDAGVVGGGLSAYVVDTAATSGTSSASSASSGCGGGLGSYVVPSRHAGSPWALRRPGE